MYGKSSEQTGDAREAIEELYQEVLATLEIDRLKQEEEDSFFLRHYGKGESMTEQEFISKYLNAPEDVKTQIAEIMEEQAGEQDDQK